MIKDFKKILRFTVLTAILVFFIYLAFKDIDFKLLYQELLKTKYLYAIAGMFIGTFIGSYVRALRWRYLLDPLKKNIPMSSLFPPVMIGYMMNAIIPRGGEVARPVITAQKEGISRAASFGTIIVERIFDMLSMFVMFGFCLFFFRQKISDSFPYDIEMISLYCSLGIIAFVLVIVVMLLNLEKTELIVEKLTKKFLPGKYQDKIHKIFISLISGFLFIKHPKSYFKIFITTALIWIFYAVSSYLAFFAFDIKLGFLDANLIVVLSSFAMTLPLPGNSAGTVYLFLKTALVSIYGVNPEVAIGYAIVTHLLNVLGILISGFYYSIKENYKFNLGFKSE
ncbi:MAG: lysylphosphatidylglycerol synthase transmembrane domain-containing protein [Ignavibacteria bacterium]|nr:lysylphosphatidylglycerol synthase transmembrane domain-containing protein [Ignavibacteria bacterium]